MRGWPVHRPTHAPATTLKTNSNSAPKKTKNQNPRAVHSRGGTAPHDHSCGQHTHSSATALKTKNQSPSCCRSRACETIPQTKTSSPAPPQGGVQPLRRTQRGGADETIPGGCFPSRLSPRRMSGMTAREGNSFTCSPAAARRRRILKPSNPKTLTPGAVTRPRRHSGHHSAPAEWECPESPAPAGRNAASATELLSGKHSPPQ